MKVLFKWITTLRQWLVLHCKKPLVIVYGARATGKTVCAMKVAAKYLKQGLNVDFIYATTAQAKQGFDYFRNLYSEDFTYNRQTKEISFNGHTLNFIATNVVEETLREQAVFPDVVIFDEYWSLDFSVYKVVPAGQSRNRKCLQVLYFHSPITNEEFIHIPSDAALFQWKSFIKRDKS